MREEHRHIYRTMCNIDSWRKLLRNTGHPAWRSNDLEGREAGWEGGDIDR